MLLVLNFLFHITAPPIAPSYSCVLTNGSGNSTRVTLTWTEPPSDGSIDTYCISSSPEYSFARSVCVTPDMRTHQYEVQQGLEYNFTILAVNCGNQNGTETAPISVIAQGMHVCLCTLRRTCRDDMPIINKVGIKVKNKGKAHPHIFFTLQLYSALLSLSASNYNNLSIKLYSGELRRD